MRLLDRAAEGLPLLRRAAAGFRAVFGENHPATLNARANLLEFEEEVAGGAELLSQCRSSLGEDHSVTLAVLLNYAGALFRSGRTTEALSVALDAVEGHTRRYGSEYPVILSAHYLLAQILKALDRPAEAAVHARTAAEGRAASLGPDHPWTLAAQQLAAAIATTAD